MTAVLFTIVILLGILLRIAALSPFKIYPDSYQSLIVAQNIQNYHSVLGYLGPQGMLYPDFFSWTRPVYPLLTLLADAQIISFCAGIFTFPLAFLLFNTLFKSSTYGLAGTLILALSFNHSVWGGFIMTETTGVFFLFAFLLLFFWQPSKKFIPEKYHDVLIGIIFAFAVLTRYEYLVLFLPLIIFLFLQIKQPFKKVFKIIFGFTLCISVVAFQLFPLQSLANIIMIQLQDFLPLFMFSIILLPIFILLTRYFLQKTTIVLLGSTFAVFILSFLGENFLGIRTFVLHDFLLIGFFFLGSILLHKKQPSLLLFVLLSLLSLGLTYYHVNPNMDRYYTHLIPFLLIPASYACKNIFIRQSITKWRFLLSTIIVVLVLVQILLTYQGLRYMQDVSWFRTAYEEKAANAVKKYLPKDVLILASQPEPYFYILKVSTHSIANTHPYVFLETIPKRQKIIIIQDMGMYNYFPRFNNFLEKSLYDKKKTTIWVKEDYHSEDKSQKEIHPITIYQTTVGELQKKIRQEKDN